jgi:hypothetical protein
MNRTITNDTAKIKFSLTNLSSNGYPVEENEAFGMLLDNAISGGAGTSYYLNTMLKFSNLVEYLDEKGISAYSVEKGLENSMQAIATDGYSKLCINVALNPGLEQTTCADGTPINGMATIQLSLPNPENVDKIVNFGILLVDLPASIVVTQALWTALFSPLLTQLTNFVQRSIESWLDTEVGADIDGLGEALGATTEEVATDVSGEAAEVIVEEEVIAELAIDLSVAAPAFAVLAVLVAVPLLIRALEKNFILHIEVTNETDVDFDWSLPYLDEGAMVTAPAASTIPKMSRVYDQWGDETDIPVMFQADYVAMNKSGFAGIGFVLSFHQTIYNNEDFAAVIHIPWMANNSIAMADPSKYSSSKDLYNKNSSPNGKLTVRYGNQRFITEIGIDALSGQHDEYHVAIRIQRL